MTLLEVMLVVVVMGIVAAITVPSLVTPVQAADPIGQVVRSARALAIARGEVLRLSITPSGSWSLDAATGTVDSGRGVAGAGAVELSITPTGRCVPVVVLPASWGGWDAARCRLTPSSS
jgi:type II secretory pathway pseudopilin PulG